MTTTSPWFALLPWKLPLLTQVAIGAPIIAFCGQYLWTRKCYIEPFGPEQDDIFRHPILKTINPRNNPSSDCSCVRVVPFSKLNPKLLEDARQGGTALIEAYCGGLWGGYAFTIERIVIELLTKDESNRTNLWSRKQLQSDTYEQGTIVTNAFLVLNKSPSSVIFRGAFYPVKHPETLRRLDNLFRLSVDLDEKRQEAKFRLRNVTFDAATTTPRDDPFGGLVGMFHKEYSKHLVESGVRNCVG